MLVSTTAAPQGSSYIARPQAATTSTPPTGSTTPEESVDLSNIRPPRGSIVRGVALAAVGSGLIAAASIGIPPMLGLPGLDAVPGGTLLNGALRFCGLVAFLGARAQLGTGDDNKLVRGGLLCAAGAAGMASAFGVFGHIGGLTAICMGVGGFLTTLAGIAKLNGART